MLGLSQGHSTSAIVINICTGQEKDSSTHLAIVVEHEADMKDKDKLVWSR